MRARRTRSILPLSLGLASVLALAGCTHGDVAPATATAPVAVVTLAPAAVAPAPDPDCVTNDDCSVHRAGGLCVPKPATEELADAEDFLRRAMTLDDLILRLGSTSSSSPMPVLLEQVKEDLSTYSKIAHERIPSTMEPQHAAWLQSGATQADEDIEQLARRLSSAPITTDAQALHADLAGDASAPHLDALAADVQKLLQDLQVAVAPVAAHASHREPDGGVPDLTTGTGALVHYLGPILDAIADATREASAPIDHAARPRLEKDLRLFSRARDLLGKDGNRGACLRGD